MENRARLKVQKKRPIKRSGRKVLLKNVLDYLKADTYMYAPLLSPPTSDFPSPNAFPSSAKGVEYKKPVTEKQWFGKQVGKYLKYDGYMYDPLLRLPHSSLEPLQDCGMMRMDDSARTLRMKVNQRTNHLGNANQSSESHLPQTDLSDQHIGGHTETVKHTVYQSCRSTSATRIVTLNSQPRAHS
ncbi:hypothetical protein JHK82_035750 [Glycine max]|uniref:Uncharacterized protein n=1 Tax=Glycine max TaxID=3847 RepID=C6T0J8_SOYBN|nr:uncharacterized protein LOC100306714 [Glycine max]ACU15021.1 unknown [Glycine max]KAG4970054.1 hypothetical protein JHK85_036475 [Glycine max]KAG4976408.1 hypothetical protein JHK86_035882 [Glycine max]KAG5112481.1 hypothetical protein JHK82_035750 [Glycine max]KAG5129757.1 hypothetical protein JHK84_036154 [Glycine max]|eukprot:NP_001235350.1 uncharacterized protein LOC100306714 [Glycine max]